MGELVAQWREGGPAARPTELRHCAEHSLRRRDDGRWEWRIDHRRIGALLGAMPRPEQLWAALRRIAVPVLVIRGDQSAVTSQAVAQRMIAILARGEVVEVPGGHDLGVENPDPVAQALAAFLERQPGSRPVASRL